MNTETEQQTEKEQEPAPTLAPENEADLNNLINDYEPEKEEAASDDAESVAMIGMLCTGIYGVLANRLGDHWALNEQEAQMIAVPAAAVLKKYAPNATFSPEAALLGAVAMITLPRLMVKTPEPETNAEPKQEPIAPDPMQEQNDNGNKPQHPAH